MKAEVTKIIEDFFKIEGEMSADNFRTELNRVSKAMRENFSDEESIIKLDYVRRKLEQGLAETSKWGPRIIEIEDTLKDIEAFYHKYKGRVDIGKIRPSFEDDDGVGKLVDEGEVPTSKSRADNYWEGKMKLIFTPTNKQIRTGADIPKSYNYGDIDFLEKYYDLKSIEFGNWLSQQDRKNYLAGLGLALYDLCQALGISPKKLSLRNKVSVAFGARGRGNATAHFESDTFAINITRYKRPKRFLNDRTKFLLASGGMGSFAHEYGHALDFFGGTYLEKHSSGALSDGRSLRVRPDKALMKKTTLGALMERLLYKIIWKDDKTHSDYYRRLSSKKTNLTDYYFRRAEIFARAFESYVHFKMAKKRFKNIFLAETKYDPRMYLTPQEMKKLEKDFDAVINAIKQRI
jgi:hypothetical protein